MSNLVDAAKTHVLRIYQEKRASASHDLANSINVIVNDVLQGRLPFEFIQNADDASLTNQGSLSFTLENDILIISHDGKPFSPQDVEKICAVAQQKYLDKVEDHEMIGQKGIGFKAAFPETDDLIVYSSPYCFRFQKNYSAWKSANRAEPYPWQITPIWTETSELPQKLDPQKVHFILKLKKPEEIRRQLEELEATPRILLFLNRLRRITILGTELMMKVNPSFERELYRNGALVSRWIYQPDPVAIPSQIRTKLQKMDPQSCPDKLKKPDYNLKLFFAFCLGDRGVIPTKDTVLSCYLPTTVRCNLPFLVNGDFLLEASRERLKVNIWNQFILEQIARRHFHWLSWLASNPRFRMGVLNVLGPPKLEGVDPQLATGYVSAYQECSTQVSFIPSQEDPSQLRSLVNCYYDTTGFFRFFQGKPLDEKIIPTLVDDQLDRVDILPSVHKVPTVTYAEIITRSKTYLERRPHLVRLFLEYFKEHWDRAHHFHSQFRQQCYLPNGYGGMSPISHFFLTSQKSDEYPACLSVPQFPADCQTPQLKDWLHNKVGLNYLSRKEIIRGPLAAFVKDKKVNAYNTISILRFLYTALQNQDITEYELSNLFPQMQLLLGNRTMKTASECYLANEYQPTFPLQNLIQDQTTLFISTEYLNKGDKIKVWRTLFIRLGVRDQVALNHPPAPQISQLRAQNVSYLDAYLTHLYSDRENSPLKTRVNNDAHTLPSFAFIPFMNLLHIEAYAHHFWAEILRNWDTVYSLCKAAQYKTPNAAARPLTISYIQYIVREMPLSTASGDPAPGKELYAPQLRDLVGEWLPTVNIPYQMSPEQAEFFSFRVHVHPLDCLVIFEKMRASAKTDISKYTQLLKHLIEGFSKLTSSEKIDFQRKVRYVIAEDGSWQLCTPALKCSMIPGALQRFDRSDRVKIVLPLDLMEQLSAIMGFGVISSIPTTLEIHGAEEDRTFTLDLRKKLPLIALCEALQLQKDPRAILQSLIPLARALKICQAPIIRLSPDSKDLLDILLVGNTLFYQKHCSGKKGKLGQKLCEYFHLNPVMQEWLLEILSLKEASITGGSKGISEFLQERGIPLKSLNELKAFYSHKDLTLSISEDEIPEDPADAQQVPAELPPPPAESVIPSEEDKTQEGIPSSTPAPVFKPTVAPAEVNFEKINPKDIPPQSKSDPKDPVQKPAAAEGQPLPKDPPEQESLSEAENDFNPVIAPSNVNFGTVGRRKTQLTSREEDLDPPREPAQKNTPAIQTEKSKKTAQDTKPIGRWGEEFIYQYFIHRFKNHANPANKTKLCFTRCEPIDRGVKIFCLDEKKEEVIIRLLWLNTNPIVDSYEQRDIDLTWIRGIEIVKRRWIEVKTSVGSQVHFYLSGKEWGFMNDHIKEYRIYHVANAGTATPLVTKIKNLYESGLRALNSIEFVGSN